MKTFRLTLFLTLIAAWACSRSGMTVPWLQIVEVITAPEVDNAAGGADDGRLETVNQIHGGVPQAGLRRIATRALPVTGNSFDYQPRVLAVNLQAPPVNAYVLQHFGLSI